MVINLPSLQIYIFYRIFVKLQSIVQNYDFVSPRHNDNIDNKNNVNVIGVDIIRARFNLLITRKAYTIS